MGYQLNGRMSEVCSCKTLCPCSVDEPADGNNCGFSWVFHFDRGDIGGLDVSGLNLAILGHHKDKVSDRKVRLAVIVDEQASAAQQDALVRAFTGQEGGPLADLAGLVQEVVGVTRAAIAFDVDKGSGSFSVAGVVEGAVQGFTSRDGTPTTLNHSRLGDLYGSPSYPGRVVRHRVTDTRFGLQFRGRQSTQSEFSFETA
ncbi:MAG: DUF1326 domain-containing protein [Burkholderiaceae bacterium]|nr:MAG: DUF1326 domain-containing protein [Burkholderiaceae bacterium]